VSRDTGCLARRSGQYARLSALPTRYAANTGGRECGRVRKFALPSTKPIPVAISEFSDPQPTIKPLRDATLVVVTTILVAAAGLGYAYWQAREAQMAAVRSELLQISRTAATLVDGDRHRLLVSADQEQSPLHRELLAPLVKFHRATKDVMYVYTAIMREDRILFILDTGLATESGLDPTPVDPIMTEYKGYDAAFYRAFKDKKDTYTDGVVRERLRSYMTVYSPIVDSKGEFVGVLGVDMWVRDLEARLARIRDSMLIAYFLTLLLSVAVGFAVFRLQTRAAEAQAREHAATEAAVAARAAAEQANRVKTQFLANMSHDLRTPLNGILGLTELLLHDDISPSARRYANLLRQSGDSMLALVNDILDIVRIESGVLKIAPVEFDPQPLIVRVADFHREAARQKSLDFGCEITDDAPRVIVGDAQRIEQVVNNLVGNAIKFTDKGSVRMRLEAGPTGGLRFQVEDTGIGIPEAARSKLFRRFSQVDDSDTRRHGGAGLGLAICRELVELMGGQIGVDDAPGGGARFWFTLPAIAPLQSGGN
jgi:signal transduction histidine kinase